MKTHLNRVAGFQKILTIQVGDHYLLVAVYQAIQAAIDILFKHREIGRIVLVAIGAQVAEDPDARVLGTEPTRDRKAPAIEERVAGERDIQERAVADDRIVAFELIAIERIVPAPLDVRDLALRVAMILGRKLIVPAVREHVEDLV